MDTPMLSTTSQKIVVSGWTITTAD
eukprot:COSAG03_NODE_12201_length_557_cov_0.751092_1_plen_24_part_10